jgi:hypothetical protein
VQNWIFDYMAVENRPITEHDRAVYAAAYDSEEALGAALGWFRSFATDIADAANYAPLFCRVLGLSGTGFDFLAAFLNTAAPAAITKEISHSADPHGGESIPTIFSHHRTIQKKCWLPVCPESGFLPTTAESFKITTRSSMNLSQIYGGPIQIKDNTIWMSRTENSLAPRPVRLQLGSLQVARPSK